MGGGEGRAGERPCRHPVGSLAGNCRSGGAAWKEEEGHGHGGNRRGVVNGSGPPAHGPGGGGGAARRERPRTSRSRSWSCTRSREHSRLRAIRRAIRSRSRSPSPFPHPYLMKRCQSRHALSCHLSMARSACSWDVSINKAMLELVLIKAVLTPNSAKSSTFSVVLGGRLCTRMPNKFLHWLFLRTHESWYRIRIEYLGRLPPAKGLPSISFWARMASSVMAKCKKPAMDCLARVACESMHTDSITPYGLNKARMCSSLTPRGKLLHPHVPGARHLGVGIRLAPRSAVPMEHRGHAAAAVRGGRLGHVLEAAVVHGQPQATRGQPRAGPATMGPPIALPGALAARTHAHVSTPWGTA